MTSDPAVSHRWQDLSIFYHNYWLDLNSDPQVIAASDRYHIESGIRQSEWLTEWKYTVVALLINRQKKSGHRNARKLHKSLSRNWIPNGLTC